jgi:hypothetical protein
VVSQAWRERSCFLTILVSMSMFNYIWKIAVLTIIVTYEQSFPCFIRKYNTLLNTPSVSQKKP